ncbi:MAG: SsrA-binding protein [Bacteroidia bacterium]|nr:MAG: SsrA-binding protein [Bacteroidia bacterium]PIE86427.1 MAG: SsrA-binding protein [Bacteroidia bacterium]
MANKINIRNKKASYLYELVERFTAGIQLQGTEIKSIRQGKVSLADSYCRFQDGELYVKMHIAEYAYGTYNNHDPRRERKLLLTARELRKLENKVKNKGFTIVPTFLFINEKGLAKLEIALARGKGVFDKRENIKQKDAKRDMDRFMKY